MYIINSFRFGGGAAPSDPDFTMLVKTDNAGTSASDQFYIRTAAGVYNYDVDWGDGNTDTGVTGDITHTYASAGTYTVKISGAFPRIFFNNGGDRLKLLEIQNWGNIAWNSFNAAFRGCSNMDVTATDVPDLSSVTDMFRMFNVATSLVGNSSFENWDVSNVINMSSMFQSASSFNQNLGIWEISSVTNMLAMFINSGMSTANYTDTIVGWANYTTTNGAPYNVNMSTQTGMTFDTSRSGGANFADAGAARTYLTTATPTGAGWTISGDTVI